jgi:hypothetical protein
MELNWKNYKFNSPTKAQLIKSLDGVSDDTIIQFNVEYPNGDNWDAQEIEVWDSSFLCQGHEGCTHTEPEMDYELVIFVRKEKKND